MLTSGQEKQALASRSLRSALLRLLIATIFALSIAVSLATSFRLWERRLDLSIDASLGNAFAVLLWLVVTILSGTLAVRGHARLGWLSVAILAASVAIGEARDIKDAIRPFFLASYPIAWMIVSAPIAIPLLILALRTLWSAARTPACRVLLLASGVFATAPLVLEYIPLPIGIAEEGSELMAAAVLVAVLMSILGWVPLSSTFVTWRFVAIAAALTVLAAGILDAREYEIRVAGTHGDRPEIDHGPLTVVSQTLPVDRAHLSRIDVWAESTGGDADLFLRLALPGQPPIRESRATTRHPRWSDQTVTFSFAPISESQGQTYEITIGSLQSSPYVFLGLSTDDPIPESEVQINGSSDSWGNDLALRAYTPGRGLVAFVALIQDRPYSDILFAVEILAMWLYGFVVIVWLTASRVHSTSRQRGAGGVLETPRRMWSAIRRNPWTY